MQGGEDDLDALLKQFELKDKKRDEVVVTDLPGSPSARLFASFTPVPGAVRAAGFHPCRSTAVLLLASCWLIKG